MAEDINQLMKVRREKLAVLQEEGKNPFEITKCEVTHHSQEIKDRYGELEGSSGTAYVKKGDGKSIFLQCFRPGWFYPGICSQR